MTRRLRFAPREGTISDVDTGTDGLRGRAVRVAVGLAIVCVAPLWLRALTNSRNPVRHAAGHSLESLIGEERVPGFVDAVEVIRNAVPRDGSYLLVTEPYGPGSLTAIAFRNAVLPRRPILLRTLREESGEPPVRPVATVVIDRDDEPPVVTRDVGLLHRLDPAQLGIEDDSIPAAVDEAVLDAKRRLRLRGWCQGAGSIPCDVAAVLLDGTSVPTSKARRTPRPDVEAAIPSLGPCPRAGYELFVPSGVVPSGRFGVRVVFRTGDGRWRIYPERFAEEAR